MQHRTSQLLYSYWNGIRNNRVAPRRFEIEPMKIAELLPETFILECGGLDSYRFRLAGTRICEQFGRELRGLGLLDIWSETDRNILQNLLDRVVLDADIGVVTFDAYSEEGRRAAFEMLLLPLMHSGATVNRLMGSISAIEPPIWMGSRSLVRFAIIGADARTPAQSLRAMGDGDIGFAPKTLAPTLVQKGERNFRVYDGGRRDPQR